MHFSISLQAMLALLFSALALLPSALAYRPVQFVKHTGQSGRADQAFSLVNYFNSTTSQYDLYIRMWMFRYKSSNKGWASLGLGPRMQGSLMFIMYGDPAAEGSAENGGLTLTVRTIDGHHPPRPLDEMTSFYSGYVPDVEIVTNRFIPYTGEWYSEEVKAKPSHLGVAEFVVRGYEKFTAPELGLHSDKLDQTMIWSSNFKQDFGGDFSFERGIEMHQFGLGFGFLWTDFLNARTEVPFFQDIDELKSHSGISETTAPTAPTEDELKKGEEIIAAQTSGGDGDSNDVVSDGGEDKDVTPAPDASTEADTSTPGPDDGSNVEEPVKTVKQWNIRSMMWHIHGFLMTLAFLVAYPLAVYLLRSPRTAAAGTAFNYHWTINALGNISVSIGAIVGFLNSHSISIVHQYLGILIVCGLAAQSVLGWRHHVVFVATGGRKTWMSFVHVILGRVLLPVGMANVISGLLLRQYGWLTISMCVALGAVEIIVLTLVVGQARNRRPGGMQKGAAAPTADEAEEYFQLAGDDDDEFSDDEEAGLGGMSAEERAKKEAEREEQRKKLAKLDRV